MVLAYKNSPSEDQARVMLQTLLQDNPKYIQGLMRDNHSVFDTKFVIEEDADEDEDILLTIMDCQMGILTNSQNPYPLAMDNSHGLAVLNRISLSPGDAEWGHMHLLHILNTYQEWKELLRRKGSQFSAIYMYQENMYVWTGDKDRVFAVVQDGVYIFSNKFNGLTGFETDIILMSGLTEFLFTGTGVMQQRL